MQIVTTCKTMLTHWNEFVQVSQHGLTFERQSTLLSPAVHTSKHILIISLQPHYTYMYNYITSLQAQLRRAYVAMRCSSCGTC